MAHFAQVDENNTVLQVVRVPDEQEYRGQDFLSKDLNLGGTWIQCSYNNNIRKRFPSVGYTYDPQKDIFLSKKPFHSWVLNEDGDWIAPIVKPENGIYLWNEELQEWEEAID